MINFNKYYIALLLASILAAGGQIFLKKGVNNADHWFDFLNSFTIIGFIFYIIGTFLWVFSLSKFSLTKVYPFTALTFILVYFGAIFFLGEVFSIKAALGCVFIIFGLSLVISGEY